MAQPNPSKAAQQKSRTPSKKRKEPPSSNNASSNAGKKQKTNHGARQRDARTLSAQTASKAFANGALDVDAFVRAREFEMRALDASMQRSKKALNRRAFQQVPKELRRRTASHNVKRIPKRLRERGKKEMLEDNTPTVTARRRKPTKHMRLRLETAKKLRALGAQKKAAKEKAMSQKVAAPDRNGTTVPSANPEPDQSTTITTRKPKVKKPSLEKPPLPKAKFRKRQICKSWLPTHLFHAKRAHMTPPSAPLWRFAIPLTPTQKSYRPTHRASHERGAVAWDTSYMATLGLEGEQRSIEGLLKALGIGTRGGDASVWVAKGEKWRDGLRIVETFALEREAPHRLIVPLTIIWCSDSTSDYRNEAAHQEKRKRKLFLRVHPSAFHELWEEVVRLSKVSKPSVRVEDLRFEIGSIQVTGPGSTEALLSALWPNKSTADTTKIPASNHEDTWRALAGVTDPSALPSGALLSFAIQDPRLHHPPQTIKLPTSQDEQSQLLDVISKWPIYQAEETAQIFDRTKRLRGSKLASQKAVNRRRSQANPGEYPVTSPADPEIPVLLHTSLSTKKAGKRQGQASWTVLAPWKTIQPIWYSLMYYPLSTGQQPRFGGLREQQQLSFEAQRPWFPADFPGTKAGWDWEIVERRRRWDEWKQRPKSKRTSWEKVDLGNGKKGEVGDGWSCDWTLLLNERCGRSDSTAAGAEAGQEAPETELISAKNAVPAEPPTPPSRPEVLSQISPGEVLHLLKTVPVATLHGKLFAVRINLINRGVPQTCARIYRLPSPESDHKLRRAWLNFQLTGQRQRKPSAGKSKHSLPKVPEDAPPHVVQQRLAQSLLQSPRTGEDGYPACPDAKDLIGFVTTGNFNLAEGQGTGIGNVLLEKVVDGFTQNGDEGRLCIVRNAGDDIGRLARWNIAT